MANVFIRGNPIYLTLPIPEPDPMEVDPPQEEPDQQQEVSPEESTAAVNEPILSESVSDSSSS
jgi:hypothetical protein